MLSYGYSPDFVHICPALPELDFPFAVIPENVVGCGPILLPSRPISQTAPELGLWLKRNPTVVINLGSHHIADAISAREMAKSFANVLNARPELQVLWKLKYDWQSDEDFTRILGSQVAGDRVRITEWIVPEMEALVETGSIVCFIHHGGANSFYEACHVGVPQIVLPVWFDTYSYATRAEYRGFGIYGNKSSAPEVVSGEFTEALVRTLDDEVMKEKARAIGKLCRLRSGREVAVDKIMELGGLE